MSNRQQTIIRTSIIGIIANILLVVAKAIVGLAANSLAIILEAVNNLTDILSSAITAIGAKLAGRAPDKEHPYGHGRIEHIATFVVGAIILTTGFGALINAIPKITAPPAVQYSVASIIVMTISIVAKIAIGLYFCKAGKSVKSDSLKGSGIDALADAAISSATLASIIVFLLTGANLEGILSSVISLFIIRAGFTIIRESWRDLIGRRADGQLSRSIKKHIASFSPISGVYDLTLHSYGSTQVIGSVHIQIPDNITAKEIHRLTREISASVYDEFHVILTIGIYAENTDTKKHREIRESIQNLIANYPEVKQLHGFYVDDTRKIISFDIIFDYGYAHKTHQKNQIQRAVHKLYPEYKCAVIVDIDVSD